MARTNLTDIKPSQKRQPTDWKKQIEHSWKGTLHDYLNKYERLSNSTQISAINININKQDEDKLVLSLNQSEDMFKIKVTAGNRDYVGLVDSGARAFVADSKLTEHLKNNIKDHRPVEEQINLRSANNEPIPTRSYRTYP